MRDEPDQANIMASDASEVVIVSAARTAIGNINGALSTLPAHQLGSVVIAEVLKRAKLLPAEVSEVILGQVLTAGQGMNPSRHAAVLAGLPVSVPTCLINQVCGSSIRAVAIASQAIKCGDASVVVAGGQESMSLAPHCVHMRRGISLGAVNLIDSMMEDGLTDCFHKCSMGSTAETVASQWKISREEQDAFALSSQRKAGQAQKEGKFKKEIVSVMVKSKRSEVTFEEDEFPKPNSDMESLAHLKPVFVSPADKEKGIIGTVTPGNATGLNDGAAAVVVMSLEEAKKRSLPTLGKIASWAHVGVDPLIMGTGPISAIRKAVSKAGWKLEDVDLFEINEAFASQSLAIVRELGIDMDKVNVNGGSIALGHPLGASGARCLVTLLYAMEGRGSKKGVVSLCIGGGMGIAMCIER
ncbi:unnamed protein product [Clavelina lepadiformis]|uniref:Acetyl-CoA acetyltransferase, cytosolic n=1 Tax=Clavelina lepadiformis TaxID=159417 RepID=A0ABP0G6B7_CLALP